MSFQKRYTKARLLVPSKIVYRLKEKYIIVKSKHFSLCSGSQIGNTYDQLVSKYR